jgi:phage terminase large subunit
MTTKIKLPAYGWSPRDDQKKAWEAIERGKKTIVLAWHRRMGKDSLALNATCIRAIQRVGSYFYCLPEYGSARKALWEGMDPATGRTRIDDAFPPEIIEKKDNQAMSLKLKNGSNIQLVGSDAYNSLMGSGIVGLVMSEAALADPAAFGFFRPMLLQSKGWSIHISSTRGKNHFYDRFNANKNNPDAFVQLLSAYDTEVFTREELAQERRDMIAEYGATVGNALFAQEYLSSWDAAIVGAVWGAEVAKLREDNRLGLAAWDPRFPVQTSWDIGMGDETCVLFWQSIGSQERLIDHYSANDSGIEHFAKVLAGKPYMYSKHYAPHDISVREWGTGASRIQTAKNFGVNFTRIPQTDKQLQYSLGARLMGRTIIHQDTALDASLEDKDHTKQQSCTPVLELLSLYRFGYDKTRKVVTAQAIHDFTSHCADAFMTYAIAKAGAQTYNAAPTVQSFEKPMRLSQMRQRGSNQTGAWG